MTFPSFLSSLDDVDEQIWNNKEQRCEVVTRLDSTQTQTPVNRVSRDTRNKPKKSWDTITSSIRRSHTQCTVDTVGTYLRILRFPTQYSSTTTVGYSRSTQTKQNEDITTNNKNVQSNHIGLDGPSCVVAFRPRRFTGSSGWSFGGSVYRIGSDYSQQRQ